MLRHPWRSWGGSRAARALQLMSLSLSWDYTCGSDESPYQVWSSQAASLLDEQRLILARSLLLSVHTNATFMCVYIRLSSCALSELMAYGTCTHITLTLKVDACLCVRVEILNVAAHSPPPWELGERLWCGTPLSRVVHFGLSESGCRITFVWWHTSTHYWVLSKKLRCWPVWTHLKNSLWCISLSHQHSKSCN